ncbi:MAG: S41 family peptidase [Rikenellaceae bacterium]
MKTVRFFLLTIMFSVIVSGSANCQTKDQIGYLETFSKAYGYVKYFHPSDEADKIDWDKFAIYGSQKIVECKNKKQLISTLTELFLPIAPTIKFFDSRKKVKFDINSITPPNIDGYKPTYWQHLGVDKGMEAQNVLYKSIRVNRDKIITIKPNQYSGFGPFSTYLKAKEYVGKQIKFTGSVKLKDGTTGTGHLWLRVDIPNSKSGFFNNMDNNPVTKTVWGSYEIIGNVDSLASGIALGCFLKGDGEMLVDDFHFYYEEGGKWVEVPIKNSDFEVENYGEMVKDKLWYSGGKGYEFSINGQESFQGAKCLSVKIDSKIEVIPGNKIFDKELNIGEVINENIGSGVSCIIPLVLYCTKESTYPVSDKTELDKTLTDINKNEYNLSQRLGDIIITWNVFQHFFPYFDVAGANWDKELERALQKSFKDSSEWDFLITLRQLTATLKDGHIRISSPKDKYHIPAISWEFIENKLVITRVYDKNIPLKPGDMVDKIEGQDPFEFFKIVKSNISAATDGWMAYRANIESLVGDKGSKLSLVVNNQPLDLIRNQTQYSLTTIDKNFGSSSKFKSIDENIIYVNIDQVDMKIIDSLLPQLVKAKAVICDLRGYPKNTTKFISYLLSKEDSSKWMFIPQFIYPDQKNIAGYKEYGWDLKPTEPHINAKIIFIIDGRAISYAESYMGFIEGYDLATIVGQPTAGTNGNINPFTLPGGYYISWTGMKVTKQDGSQHQGIGIIPDILVNKTIKGVKEGRDEFLEKAVELARSSE